MTNPQQLIERLQGEARDAFLRRTITFALDETHYSILDTLIIQTHQATIAEVVRIIKDELQNAPLEVQMTKGVIFANVINRITSNKE